MKRTVAFFMLLMILLLTACGEGESTSSNNTDTTPSVSSSDMTDITDSNEDVTSSEFASQSSTVSTNETSDSASDVSSESQTASTDITTDTEAADSTVSEEIPAPPDPLQVIAGGVEETELLTGDLVATSVCTLKNLPVGNAVQRFFLIMVEEQLYIFTTQRSGTTTYLSRCRYDPKTKLAYCLDSISLQGYGHGESLEVRVRNGKVYVYVGAEANMANSYAWSLEISRFVYDKGKKTEECKLGDFEYATKDGYPLHSGATSYRVNFSLNEESDRFLIYVRCDTNFDKSYWHYFVSYRLSELDRILDEEGSISILGCKSAFLENHGVYNKCPHGSFQGMDLCADGKTVYVCGGAEGEQPQIQRSHIGDPFMKPDELCNITEIYSARIGMSREYITTLKVLPEIESFQQFNGRFYFSFNPGSGLKKNNTEIFVLSLAS